MERSQDPRVKYFIENDLISELEDDPRDKIINKVRTYLLGINSQILLQIIIFKKNKSPIIIPKRVFYNSYETHRKNWKKSIRIITKKSKHIGPVWRSRNVRRLLISHLLFLSEFKQHVVYIL